MPLFRRDPDPFSPSSYGDVFKSVRARQRKHMRKRWQWYILGTLVTVTLLAGLGLWKYYQLQGKLHQGGPETEERVEGKPFNVLLVGSDSREGLTPEEQLRLGANPVGGQRADTLILAHIDPETDHVIMVQFPRDLYVPIAGGGEDRINSALQGGSQRLVATVKQLTGLKIEHYIQVNIAGFRDLVDEIDGVDICVPQEVPFDANTGFQVTKPGTIHFDGDLAIRFVRSRHAFPGGDFDRIANQQKFIAAALDKITSVGTILDPGRVLGLADIAGKNLRIDKNLTILGLKKLAGQLRSLDPDRYEAYTAPNLGTGNINGASVVLPDMDKLEFVFDAIGRNESPAEADGVPSIDPHTIRVGVYNGVDLFQPYAGAARDELWAATGGQTKGLSIVEVANAPHFKFKETVIRYKPAHKERAELVAAVLPEAELQEHRTPDGVDVAVIVGDVGFRAEPLVQILALPIPRTDEQPAVCDQEGEAPTG